MSSRPPFSFDTVEGFDNHIDLSIPSYSTLQNAILRIATHFVRENSQVVDLGCSTGVLLSRLAPITPDSTRLLGIDKSENLLSQRADDDRVIIQQADLLADDFSISPSCLVMSIFTLQFLPVDKRQALVDKVYDALPEGGAFILAEKQYINDGYLQDTFTFSYYDLKLQHFSAEEILSKQLSLRRIMRPVTEGENRQFVSKFSRVISFWQILSFKAFLCIK